jgi:threonine dehydrogenase-like Zn-dependent dehydrogenase
MNDLFKCVRATGAIGVVGVFAESDPKSPDTLARSGKLALDWGVYFEKGLRVGSGQTNVKAYNRRLCTLIKKGVVRPSFVVSHELPLEEAPRAYRHVDARDEGCTKVILNPTA